VLPDSNDPPSRRSQLYVRVPVSSDVPSQLLRPPFPIRERHGLVFRALMPEAPVYEDGNVRSSKDEIRSSARSKDWRRVDSIPQSTTV
jgi:hypothetical protein